MSATWQASRRPALISPLARWVAWGWIALHMVLALLVSFAG